MIDNIPRSLDNSSLISLRILDGMLKGPVALIAFSLDISSSIAVEHVGKRKKLSDCEYAVK